MGAPQRRPLQSEYRYFFGWEKNASIGDILRDSRGLVHGAFSKNMENEEIQELEKQAIYQGILLAMEMKVENLWIETDSLYAVNVIKGAHNSPWKKKATFANIKKNLRSFKTRKISHTWREANAVADFLSKSDCPCKGAFHPSLFPPAPFSRLHP
ncbi:uncharacterized protein LOC143882882 [Tasmannia lanceolata]|uniref:uncharacterized protein LOC143882882 n=1 Tax=Tasmannia lanceolata TaxID=3420 RepID=UPI0040646C31